MKVYKVRAPKSYYCSNDKLSKGELSNVKASGADLAIYWYATGSWEGSGHLLLLKDGFWMQKSLSHCSCYGPVDHPINLKRDFDQAFASLEDLEKTYSDQYYSNDISPLVNKARKLIEDKS